MRTGLHKPALRHLFRSTHARWALRSVGVVLSLALTGGEPACAPPPRQVVPVPAASWARSPTPTWQVQLRGELDLTVPADVFELDAFSTAAADVDTLHTAGRRVICYVNAGAYEPGRPDSGRFPANALGAAASRAGERWLDIRRWPALQPVLEDRLRLCRGKGFDAVAFDNVDGYAQGSGFPVTYDEQLVFNRRLAALARTLGLSPGLKDDLDQVVALEPDFDFAVNTECFRHDECERLRPFVDAGKPVFHLEYDVPTAEFCPTTRGWGFASIRKRPELDAWREPC
jgi:hypothetical protein